MGNLIKLVDYCEAHGVTATVTDHNGMLALAISVPCRSVQTGRDFFITEYARTYAEVREVLGY